MLRYRYSNLIVFLICFFCINTKVGLSEEIKIDFNDLNPNEVITTQFSEKGIHFNLLDIPINYMKGPKTITINSNLYPKADGIGITTRENGNVDINYDIEINFANDIDYFSILSLDSDEPITINAYYNDDKIESKHYRAGSDLQIWKVEIGEIGGSNRFDRIVLDLVKGSSSNTSGGPEYFDNLVFNTIRTTCERIDSDNDGVIDDWDECPDTLINSCVNRHGCQCSVTFIEEDDLISQGKWKFYSITLPSDFSQLDVKLFNYNFDTDLYVKKAIKPDEKTYDCRPYKGADRTERCELSNDEESIWHIGIYGCKSAKYNIKVEGKRCK